MSVAKRVCALGGDRKYRGEEEKEKGHLERKGRQVDQRRKTMSG